jgi:hypothetical protein
LPEKFEIAPHVVEMMKCIVKLYYAKILEDKPVLIEAVKQLENFIAPLENNKGTPCVFTYEDLTGDNRNLQIKIEWIPIHLIEVLKEE